MIQQSTSMTSDRQIAVMAISRPSRRPRLSSICQSATIPVTSPMRPGMSRMPSDAITSAIMASALICGGPGAVGVPMRDSDFHFVDYLSDFVDSVLIDLLIDFHFADLADFVDSGHVP